MTHIKKCHQHLVHDSARALNVSYYGLFAIYLRWNEMDKDEAEKEASWLLEKFVDSGVVSEDMVDNFCLPVLTGKIKKRYVKGGGFVLYEVLDDK